MTPSLCASKPEGCTWTSGKFQWISSFREHWDHLEGLLDLQSTGRHSQSFSFSLSGVGNVILASPRVLLMLATLWQPLIQIIPPFDTSWQPVISPPRASSSAFPSIWKLNNQLTHLQTPCQIESSGRAHLLHLVHKANYVTVYLYFIRTHLPRGWGNLWEIRCISYINLSV